MAGTLGGGFRDRRGVDTFGLVVDVARAARPRVRTGTLAEGAASGEKGWEVDAGSEASVEIEVAVAVAVAETAEEPVGGGAAFVCDDELCVASAP